VREGSRSDLLGKLRRNIGSPAKYSLFGAPRTLAFEGISDINLFSAFNEYIEQNGTKYLNKDSYSVNSFNGISKAPEFCKTFKTLKVDFVLVVDSGSATLEMQKKLENGDFGKYFVEINEVLGKDGDMEDLCDPILYHKAFELAYKGILSTLPTFEEIEKIGKNKKIITRYDEWFKRNSKEFNKTIVAQQMFNILMREDIRKNINAKLIEDSVNNFKKLIEIVNKGFLNLL